MLASNHHIPHDSAITFAEDSTMRSSVISLNELLTHTLAVRDLYKIARCQAADMRFRQWRLLFDTHYQEQLRLVAVLFHRIRVLRGASGASLDAFPQETQPSCALSGHLVPHRLLCDLLDAHELVLRAAHTAGTNSLDADPSAAIDFAVGQVVLTNDLQGHSVREQLVRLDRRIGFATASFSGADAYE